MHQGPTRRLHTGTADTELLGGRNRPRHLGPGDDGVLARAARPHQPEGNIFAACRVSLRCRMTTGQRKLAGRTMTSKRSAILGLCQAVQPLRNAQEAADGAKHVLSSWRSMLPKN